MTDHQAEFVGENNELGTAAGVELGRGSVDVGFRDQGLSLNGLSDRRPQSFGF
jgi:hypothetical protein